MLARVSILFLMTLLTQATSASAAAAPVRIASLNMCTDQLLLALADSEQIAGLSPYARDRDRSFMATAADRFPVLSGGAEDVLVLAPTSSSLAGTRGGQRASSCVQKGCRLSSLTSRARSATPRSKFYEWGVLWATPTGPRPRLSKSMRRSSEPARQRYECRRRVEFLAVSRRGWVSGGETLTTSLLATAGLANAAPDLGLRSGGFATLE